MPPNIRPITQEVPTVDFLAKEAKDLLVYAAQEGTSSDLRAFYNSLDIEKILAFVAVEAKHLEDYPKEIVQMLLNDQRKAVVEVLKANPSVRELTQFFSAKEYGEAQGLSHEEVVESGRRAVARVIRRASSKSLRDDEVEGVRVMAHNIPDERVVEAMFPLAEKYPSIALELAYNPGLADGQVNRLVEIAMQKFSEDPKWDSVVMELVASPENHGRLSHESLAKIEANPLARVHLDTWNVAESPNPKVIGLPKPGKKQAKTSEERRADRRAKRREAVANGLLDESAEALEEVGT
jgi:hypothetical protein